MNALNDNSEIVIGNNPSHLHFHAKMGVGKIVGQFF
jgi:hypothetical protein